RLLGDPSRHVPNRVPIAERKRVTGTRMTRTIAAMRTWGDALMSSPLPSSSATAAGSRPRLSAGAVLDRATWLAVMLIIVAAGLMLLRTYRAMLRESTAAPVEKRKTVSGSIPDRDRNPQAEQIPETLLLQPGAWSLGESKWTLALIDLSDGSGETR